MGKLKRNSGLGGFRGGLILLLMPLLLALSSTAFAATYYVDDTSDPSMGTWFHCSTSCDGTNDCSLRDAIDAANSGDTIAFCGPQTHTINTMLTINKSGITIDGGSVKDVVIHGPGGFSAPSGFVMNGVSNNVIKGLVIYGFFTAIRTTNSSDNTFQSNYIGVGADGATVTSATTNQYGIFIQDGSNNIIKENVIAGSQTYGIFLYGNNVTIDTSGNIIQGNMIGTDATGTVVLGNGSAGVVVWGGTVNTVGGTSTSLRNIISGNSTGIYVVGDKAKAKPATGNVILGNYIGTDVGGTLAVPNTIGIHFYDASQNVVGGSTPEARNIISGNNFAAVTLNKDTLDGSGPYGRGNKVQGNFIGTTVTGDAALPNDTGILISRSSDNIIGMDGDGVGDAGEGNVISGNTSNALQIFGMYGNSYTSVGNANTIQGNFIGTDATGILPIGNGGIAIDILNTSNNIIGGSEATRNIIANNGSGVRISGHIANTGHLAKGNVIRSNLIYQNSGLGIDLSAYPLMFDGVTPNDAGDADDGPNGMQNYPVITAVTYDADKTIVNGYLNSVVGVYGLEFFSNTVCNSSGFGEGKTYLGTLDLAVDTAGDIQFSAVLPPVPSDAILTATATDQDGNTSEFGECFIAKLQFGESSYTVSENGGSVTVTVTRTGRTDGVSTVNFVMGSEFDSAQTSVDYIDASRVLQFDNGETEKAVTITILDDMVFKGDRMATLTLANPVGGLLASPNTSYIFISEDDFCVKNGMIDGIEECDGENLNGLDCTWWGFECGTLKCGDDCRFDTSGCGTANSETSECVASGGGSSVGGGGFEFVTIIPPDGGTGSEPPPSSDGGDEETFTLPPSPTVSGDEGSSGSTDTGIELPTPGGSNYPDYTVENNGGGGTGNGSGIVATFGGTTGGGTTSATPVDEETSDDSTSASESGTDTEKESVGGGLDFIGDLTGGGLRCTLTPSEPTSRGILGEVVVALFMGLFYIARRRLKKS